MKDIWTIKGKWKLLADRLWERHPVAGIVALGIGMPAAMTAAVFLITVMVMLPTSYINGWM